MRYVCYRPKNHCSAHASWYTSTSMMLLQTKKSNPMRGVDSRNGTSNSWRIDCLVASFPWDLRPVCTSSRTSSEIRVARRIWYVIQIPRIATAPEADKRDYQWVCEVRACQELADSMLEKDRGSTGKLFSQSQSQLLLSFSRDRSLPKSTCHWTNR